jgi:hypothetical protein
VKIRSNDDYALGVMFKDNDNCSRFSLPAQENLRRIKKNVNGTLKVLAQDAVA